MSDPAYTNDPEIEPQPTMTEPMSAPTTAETPLDLRGHGYAPGNYMFVCTDCGRERFAAKRARRCLDCAVTASAAATTAETPTMLACPKCGATSWTQASTQCRPDGDACLADDLEIEWPDETKD